jgi:hypothetical protein
MTSTDGELGHALPVASSAEGDFPTYVWDPGSYLAQCGRISLPLSLLSLRLRLRFRERTPSRGPWEFKIRPPRSRDGLPYMVVPSFFAISTNIPTLY